MNKKRIAALLMLILTLFTLINSLTACGKEYEIPLPKQTKVNLEFNYYDVDFRDKNSSLSEIGAEKHLSYFIRAKKDDDEIIVCYSYKDAVAQQAVDYFKAKMDSDKEKYADYEYGLIKESETEINIIYFGTPDAIKCTVERSWFAQLRHTFVEGENYKYILKGLGNTIIITLGALLIGVVLGVIIAVAKYYSDGNPRLRIVNILCDLYTTVIRGIPITVLLLIFFFIILVKTDGVVVAIIAFGINSGAYMAELVRSGISAVDSGQMEAARSLGLSKWQAMRKVIFPQAIKNILPAIGNEFIALLKETSVAGYVAVVDLTRGATLIRNNTYDAFNPLILSALIYLILVVMITKLLALLERRFSKSERRINK